MPRARVVRVPKWIQQRHRAWLLARDRLISAYEVVDKAVKATNYDPDGMDIIWLDAEYTEALDEYEKLRDKADEGVYRFGYTDKELLISPREATEDALLEAAGKLAQSDELPKPGVNPAARPPAKDCGNDDGSASHIKGDGGVQMAPNNNTRDAALAQDVQSIHDDEVAVLSAGDHAQSHADGNLGPISNDDGSAPKVNSDGTSAEAASSGAESGRARDSKS